MAKEADEVLWHELLNGPVVVHLMGNTFKEIATWLKKEYWEGACTMPDSVLVRKLEAAKNKGFLRHRRLHGVVKSELRTLQPHERVTLERRAYRKAQHADRKAQRVLAHQARLTPVPTSTLIPSSLKDQIEQCWQQYTTDQHMRYPAAA